MKGSAGRPSWSPLITPGRQGLKISVDIWANTPGRLTKFGGVEVCAAAMIEAVPSVLIVYEEAADDEASFLEINR